MVPPLLFHPYRVKRSLRVRANQGSQPIPCACNGALPARTTLPFARATPWPIPPCCMYRLHSFRRLSEHRCGVYSSRSALLCIQLLSSITRFRTAVKHFAPGKNHSSKTAWTASPNPGSSSPPLTVSPLEKMSNSPSGYSASTRRFFGYTSHTSRAPFAR